MAYLIGAKSVDESGRTKKMITGYPFSCTTLCTRVGGVENGSSLFSACLFYSSSLMTGVHLSIC